MELGYRIYKKIRPKKFTLTHKINPTAVGIKAARAVYFTLPVSLYTVIIEVEQGQ